MKYLPRLLLLLSMYNCSNEKPVIKNKEVIISYNISGKGDTALVFVHGWCINKEYWQEQQSYFSKRYTTIAIDLGGHGQSGTNRISWTVDDYADDVIAVINGLHLKKVVLIGHSMSGDVNLIVANKIPDVIVGFAGIDNLKDILLSFSPEDNQNMNSFFEAASKNFDTVATSYCYNYLFPPNYSDTASMNRVIRDVQKIDSVIAIETLRNLAPAALKEAGLLSGLRVPVYLIVSDLSPVNDTAVRKYCKAGLYVKTIKGVGHYPMIENPSEFNRLLQESLNEMSLKK